MAISSLKTLDQGSIGNAPDPDTLVKRARSDVLGVGRDSNSCDTILNSEGQSVDALLDIPKADGSIATA